VALSTTTFEFELEFELEFDWQEDNKRKTSSDDDRVVIALDDDPNSILILIGIGIDGTERKRTMRPFPFVIFQKRATFWFPRYRIFIVIFIGGCTSIVFAVVCDDLFVVSKHANVV